MALHCRVAFQGHRHIATRVGGHGSTGEDRDGRRWRLSRCAVLARVLAIRRTPRADPRRRGRAFGTPSGAEESRG